jgi:hypothetical protein
MVRFGEGLARHAQGGQSNTSGNQALNLEFHRRSPQNVPMNEIA